MAQLTRGSVTDRPWGMTLGALGKRGLTGEVTVTSDGKQFRIAFEGGAVVAAHSPLINDAAVRLALTSNLVNSTQVADITRRMAAAPEREELELLAEIVRIPAEQAQKMRRRLVAQRAARTFSLDRGEFVVDDQVTLPIAAGSELDIRAIVYMGSKNMLSEQRLADEIEMLGGWFKLKPEAVGELAQFGFTAAEKPMLQMLLGGANVVDIEAAFPETDARSIRAVVYAVAVLGACEAGPGPALSRTAPGISVARTSTGNPAAVARTSTGNPAAIPRTSTGNSVAVARTPTPASPPRVTAQQPIQAPQVSPAAQAPVAASGAGAFNARQRRPSMPPPGSENWNPTKSSPHQLVKSPSIPPPISMAAEGASASPAPPIVPPSSQLPSRPPAPRRAKRDTASTIEVEQLLASKLPLLDAGADHFALLGIPQTASAEDVRQVYFLLARKLHPDRLSALGFDDEARNAQRLMAQINAAFGVLNDPAKRAEYASLLARGGEAAIKAEQAKADEMAMRILRAEELFRQGEMSLRREQLPAAIDAFKQACELQPNESEYQALLAWAQFAAATDKNAIANQTRRALQKAAEVNDLSPTAPFFLGRVERMLGREKEALHFFHEVLRIRPSHSEAASEARILEQRLKGKR